jgi:hypothetical protein
LGGGGRMRRGSRAGSDGSFRSSSGGDVRAHRLLCSRSLVCGRGGELAIGSSSMGLRAMKLRVARKDRAVKAVIFCYSGS